MKKRFRILIPVAILLFCNFAVWLTLRLVPYPELTAALQQDYSTRIYDRKGNIIQITSLQNGLRREFTPIDEIPEAVKKTFITAEDQRFYFHHGVDYIAIIKAFFQNKAAGKTIRGASTITMQLVKIISNDNSYGIKRKISDAFNAYRIEAKLSKKQILELYLNSVPFGQNSDGITSGARTFFNGADLKELTPAQTCCLAVIPRRPNLYSPLKNPEVCGTRGAELAEKVFPELPVSEISAAAYGAKPYAYPFYMPHFVNYAKKEVLKKYGNTGKLYDLYLSPDLQVQFNAENQLRTAMAGTDVNRISNASMLVIDNSDNSVLAWVGNHFWEDMEHSGQIDGVITKNQPGSSMKPFLYALALDQTDEHGEPLYYPSKIMADVPSEFGQEKLYIPANFNNRFNGPVRFRIALASSLNIPAVAILDDVGVENYLNKLYEMDFNSLREGGKEADLGLALGAGEVTLKELVNGFSVFAEDGKFTPITIFAGNDDKNDNKEEGSQIYTKDTVRLIDSILSDKSARALGFGANQTFQTDYPSIFKTGTSNQYQNIVALGATKRFTVGVWMGNFSGQTVIGKTGSSFPALVAKNILDYLEKDHRITLENSFPEPENWHKERICSLSGLKTNSVCPGSVMEYVKNGSDISYCTWHTVSDGEAKVVLPSEYQQWIRLYNKPAEINHSTSRLILLTPNDGALFYYSIKDRNHQSLPVELAGGDGDELSVYYDGRFYKTCKRPFKFNLPLEVGKHQCRLSDGFEEIQFSFTVR